MQMQPGMAPGVMECIKRIWNNNRVIRFLHGKSFFLNRRTIPANDTCKRARNARLFRVFAEVHPTNPRKGHGKRFFIPFQVWEPGPRSAR